jgi:hypothetical protein
MPDTSDEPSTPKKTQREAQEALEKQVAELKREIDKINRTLARVRRRSRRGGGRAGIKALPVAPAALNNRANAAPSMKAVDETVPEFSWMAPETN